MRTLKLDDFYNYHFLSNLNTNPAGTMSAVITAKCDVAANDYERQLWLLRDDVVLPLVNDGKIKSYIWEDDANILFAANRSTRDKKRAESGDMFTSYYRINVNGGEAVHAFTLPFVATSIAKVTDEIYVAGGMVDYNHPDFYKMTAEEKAALGKEYKREADYEVIDEHPWWFNGVGMINKKRTGLFVCNVVTGEVKRVTEKGFRLNGMDVKGNTVYYFGEAFDEKMSNDSDIFTYDVLTGENKKISTKAVNLSGVKVLGDVLVISASEGKRYGMTESPRLYTMPLTGGEMKMLLDVEQGPGNSVGSDCRLGATHSLRVDGDKVYFTATTVNAGWLYECDLEGNCKPVIAKEGSVDDFDVKNGKVICVGMYNTKLQEVYKLADGELEQETNFNGDILKDTYVATPQKLTVKSCGLDVDGWVLLPKDYDESKKYPAILDIHGGPKTAFGETFFHEMQAWANMGYFVFFCNPYGSDGKGNAFADLRGKYGTVDYQNIMDFTDAVLEKYPAIDTAKVAVTGGSYGGFMTNWIIGHTDRFVAAATQRSISNWISFYGISDIGIKFGNDQCDANIFSPEGVEKMWNASPLKYVADMKTPTLFIHSDQDYRCPIAEGYQLYTALKDKGVDTRMCVFHGENHELSRGGKPLHRMRRLTEITNWIEKYTR